MKYIVSYLVISLFSNSLAQGFEAKENSGLNKLERINSVETYMVKMDATIKTMKSELKNLQGPSKLKELVDSLSRNQESLKNEIEQIRTVDISQLQSDIEFVDKEKVEKLIDKFLKYQEATDKRIKLLENSLKEIDGQLKRVDSPIKS